jgi:hypothetical protein
MLSFCLVLPVLLVLQVKELVERTRRMKSEVEAAMATLLNGRRVNILGEINNVLAATA